MMTAPDPQETWQDPPPRCPVCFFAMPTPAHIFLHEQQHGANTIVPPEAYAFLPMRKFAYVAALMQAYADSRQPREEAPLATMVDAIKNDDIQWARSEAKRLGLLEGEDAS